MPPARRVLLTGATGFLGAHLVEALAARGVAVTCLVRAADDAAARTRLAAALAQHAIPALPIDALAGDLADPALADAIDGAIAARGIDAIVHAGAQVSWLASYQAIRAPNVLGTRQLLALAARRGLAVHHVSTISVAPVGGDETATLAYGAAVAGTPYGLSKWIAEEHVRRAPVPVAIYRPAMIAHHTRRGTHNADDFTCRYLAGVRALGRYLDRDDAIVDLTPVDYVAGAIAALVAAPARDAGRTYHLVNADQSPTYAQLGRALVARGAALAPATYAEFRAALLADRGSRLHALAAFFPARFALGAGPWPCEATLAALGALGVVRPDARAPAYLDIVAGA